MARIKVVDVELSTPPQPLGDLDEYQGLKAVVRLHGTPIGYVDLPFSGKALAGNALAATDLRRVILRRLTWPAIRHHLKERVKYPLPPGELCGEEPMNVPRSALNGSLPLVTVAVCTRDRTEDLKLCLDALLSLDYHRLDIVVVDNAPSTDATARLVKDSYPQVRYVRESRPGLDWARNRAISEARGEIIAYTDDDVVVDPGWVSALVAAFAESHVMAVTGLVAPYELETEAQILFERYRNFGRGFKRRYWRMDRESGERPLRYFGTGDCGTGANMAFRRSLFERIGPFDPALDVGTVTNGGGDLEMFFRCIKEGYTLVYEPAAMVRHRHRRDYAALRWQLANNGIGFYSYLVRTALTYPNMRAYAVAFGLWWFWHGHLRRLIASFIRPWRFPRDLIWAELWGCVLGLWRYPRARRRAARLASVGDGSPTLPSTVPSPAPNKPKPGVGSGETVGVRTVDLCNPLQGLCDVADHAEVRFFATLGGRPIGCVDIANHHQPVGETRLREAIVDHLGLRLLGEDPEIHTEALWESAKAELRQRYLPTGDETSRTSARLPDDVAVSIVVATYDRPDDLRECLRCLTMQETTRPVEIVVVDNHPVSGLTPPVIVEFPGVVLTDETRQGLAYARNKGFTTSRGEVVIATDDDVLAPPDWLEKLVAPFVRPDVAVVTGNTLPLDLETPSQRSFERYGGLGRGFVPREADSDWSNSFRLRAVPTWTLGATANAAFRASIFVHPEIGLMDEVLGPGTPTGVGEDTYLFYKVLKADYTVVYEASAYVWHKHRREMLALSSQIYNYSKGHVAYHLTTLLRDRDLRAMTQLAFQLPRWHLKRLMSHTKRRLFRERHYPLRLILLEVRGNLAGPWCLWRSHRRVKREGYSDPYVAVSQRVAAQAEHQDSNVVSPAKTTQQSEPTC